MSAMISKVTGDRIKFSKALKTIDENMTKLLSMENVTGAEKLRIGFARTSIREIITNIDKISKYIKANTKYKEKEEQDAKREGY